MFTHCVYFSLKTGKRPICISPGSQMSSEATFTEVTVSHPAHWVNEQDALPCASWRYPHDQMSCENHAAADVCPNN
ncbi:hypothetical protein LEMLEM_LOCUS1804 [Lemmus lemmus]